MLSLSPPWPSRQRLPSACSGKRSTSAVRSQAAEESRADSFWRRAVGKCITRKIRVAGVDVIALVDTGSQVTTIMESWFNEHLRQTSTHNTYQFRLTAANGQPIPTVGCCTVDVVCGQQTVKDVVIVIVTDRQADSSQPPCLLGMNLLCRLKEFQTAAVLLKAPRVNTVIPARSVHHIVATAGGPDWWNLQISSRQVGSV